MDWAFHRQTDETREGLSRRRKRAKKIINEEKNKVDGRVNKDDEEG